MMALHQGLQERFFRHQRALLDRDVAAAQRWLVAFAGALTRHVDDEERVVLPRFAERGGEQTNSPPAQFRLEHHKLLAQVARLRAATDALGPEPDDRALLALLDLEASFKSLLLHHDLREARVLYPKVAEWTSADEQEAMLAAVSLRALGD